MPEVCSFRVLLLAAILGALASGCAQVPEPYCEGGGLRVDARFDGGGLHSCRVRSGRHVELLVRPEDKPPINPSSWYAFRLSSDGSRSVEICIRFEGGPARYWPKLSRDGLNWDRAPESAVRFAEDGSTISLDVTAGEPDLWVAGQPLLLPGAYDEWLGDLDRLDHAETRVIGRSVEDRPILAVLTPARPEVIFLFGRQHPPEVTGALAMRSFVDAVLADTEIARAFRERYQVVIVPLINPDGVVHGHWRHNVNGVDLNRDWGPFTQPETQSVGQLIDTIEARGARPALMLDFHSTRGSLYYTQLPEETSWPIDFATVWFERVRARTPGFDFRHEPRARSEQANTKNYFFDRYRIPSYTYEIGDEVEPHDIAATTPVFAEEMMRLLLEYSEEQQVSNRDNPIASEGRDPAVPLSSPNSRAPAPR